LSLRALIRHHTGRMAGPARWYLAGLAVISLLLLTAHFSVQEHVQKNMRQAVHDWLKQSGGDVQHVRYRLLRGALTMERLTWVDPADPELTLDVARVFVRTSSRVMLSSTPSFSELHLEQPVLSLRRDALLGWLRGDRQSALNGLTAFLQHVQSVSVEDMSLLVSSGQDGGAEDLLLQQVVGQVSSRGMHLKGSLDAGTVQLQTTTGDAGTLSGRLLLSGISMASLAVLSGGVTESPGTQSSPSGATASGELVLSGDWKKHDVGLQGTMRLTDGVLAGSFVMQGGWSATGIDVDLDCKDVSLASLPLDWPVFAGRSLTAGRFSGAMHVERSWMASGESGTDEQSGSAWRIAMDGALSDVLLGGEHLPAWRIGSIRLNKARLSGVGGSFAAEAMRVSDADLSLNAYTSATGSSQAATLQIEDLKLERIRAQLLFADGSGIVLPELRGSGRLASGPPEGLSAWHLSLASAADEADLAGGGEGEKWMLEARGDLSADWQAKVKGAHVPVVRLRPLMPRIALPGEQGVPEYSGHADFQLQLRPIEEGIQLEGHAVLQDVRMMQGGDQLTATRIEADITEAGSNGRRRLSRLELSDWHYQMALRPLPRINALPQTMSDSVPAAASASDADAASSAKKAGNIVDVSESTAPMRAFNWEIEELVAQDGRISLGQADALIAGDMLLRVHHLAGGLPAHFTLSGTFADGELQAVGKLVLQPGLLLDAKLDVSNALPFVFNDWMRLSGMPGFVRGRMDARFSIAPVGPVLLGAYGGKLSISLHQGALAAGAFPDDPMLQRTGYSSLGLLERLNASRRVSLAIPFHGAWPTSSLAGNLGEAGLAVLKSAAARTSAATGRAEIVVAKLTRLRLQGKRGFSHNERVRLRQMAKALLADPSLIVELTPQLGTAQPDADMTARVRFSQRLVEDYLRKFGVAGKRIFPVWPQSRHQRGDAPGLLLQAHAP